jgi:hypothetical protein
MVAYSFQRRFVNPIRVGLGLDPLAKFPAAFGPKRHTIRGPRVRGHAREGQPLQLYFGQRSPASFLIGRAVCIGIMPVTLVFDDDPEHEGVISPGFGITQWGFCSLDEFAIGDGFENWAALKNYWRIDRGYTEEFSGSIIFWDRVAEERKAAA